MERQYSDLLKLAFEELEKEDERSKKEMAKVLESVMRQYWDDQKIKELAYDAKQSL